MHMESNFDFSVPIGTIISFAGQIYDWDEQREHLVLKEYLRLAGWIESSGQCLKKADFPILYNMLGNKYTFPTDPTDSFRVPDLRGLFLRGVQNQPRENQKYSKFDDTDYRFDYITLDIASHDKGVEMVGTVQYDDFKQHKHSINNLIKAVGGSNSPSGEMLTDSSVLTKSTEISPESGGLETRPNNIALYFLIKVEHSHLRTNLY